jgi:hypothetical protein
MCYAFYLAASVPLPERPATIPVSPLTVLALEADDDAVRRQFSKAHIYKLGAHTGCSCGFAFTAEFDLDSAAAPRESIRDLRSYLASALTTAGTLELFVCWEGDQGGPIEEREDLTLDVFDPEAEKFSLTERWLGTLRSPQRHEAEPSHILS